MTRTRHVAGTTAAAGIAAGVTTAAVALGFDLLALLAPGVGLLAFLWLDRPCRPLPDGPVDESGRAWGWSWLRVAGTVVWLPHGQAAEPRSRPVHEPGLVPTHAGFELPLDPSSPPRPVGRASALNGLVHLGLVGVVLVVLVGWQLSEMPKIELGNLARDANLLSLLALLVGVAVVDFLIVGVLLAVVAVWTFLPPLVHLGVRSVLLSERTPITFEGALLKAGDETFYLGRPEQAAHLGWDRHGARLVLRNDSQELTLRGRHDLLAWLAERVDSVALEGGEQDVPEALRAMANEVRESSSSRSPDRPTSR